MFVLVEGGVHFHVVAGRVIKYTQTCPNSMLPRLKMAEGLKGTRTSS